jgi:hypothetical protein
MPYPKMEPVIVEELAGEDRGGGFGSTDKKEENENAEQGRESGATEGDNQSVQ